MNAICTKCPGVKSAGALSAGTKYRKVLGVNAAYITKLGLGSALKSMKLCAGIVGRAHWGGRSSFLLCSICC